MMTYKKVRMLFDYREDGKLIRKFKTKMSPIGSIIEFKSGNGHISTVIGQKQYGVHRIVWLWHHGYIPENGLDHIDRDKTNNRIGNLREVTQSCNMRNTGNSKGNSSGVRGVSFSNGRWIATIGNNNRQHFLGSFDDKLEAVCHRLAAEQCLCWHDCNPCSPAYVFIKKHLNEPRRTYHNRDSELRELKPSGTITGKKNKEKVKAWFESNDGATIKNCIKALDFSLYDSI